MDRLAMACDGSVIELWAAKLAPLCDQAPATCEIWLAAFLTAIRLSRCEGLPEEARVCGHENPFEGARDQQCVECLITLGKREGHTEAGVYWTAGEVMDRATRFGRRG